MNIEVKDRRLSALASTMKPLHLRMAQSLAEGNTQEKSYRDAKGRGKDGRKCASDLIRTNPDILEYSELAKEIAAFKSQEQLVATVDQKRRALWEIAQQNMEIAQSEDGGEGQNMINPNAAISAIAELNKMDGDLAAIKTDNKHHMEKKSLAELMAAAADEE